MLAVVLDWGLIAVSSSFVISGLYFVFVAVFVTVTPGARQRGFGGIIGISVWGTMMIVMGAFGMSAALGT